MCRLHAGCVLDFGCGKGHILDRLAARLPGGIQLHSCDPDQGLFQRCQERRARGVTWSASCQETVEELAGACDVVVCSLVLCTLEDPEEHRRALRQIRQALSSRFGGSG